MSQPFLLEIGVEEIPDWMIRPALDHLQSAFTKLLQENRLPGAVLWTEATPRRLALKADGLPAGQKDSEELIGGPPKSAGEGAAAGFARKMGVEPGQLESTQTPKGEYYCFRRKVPGRKTADLLSEQLPALILGIPWPKAMYWEGKGGARFIRPIRWIVALLGAKVVPFEAAGVASGKLSQGHRRLGKKKIAVTIARYPEQMRQNAVIVSAAERKGRIEEGIEALLEASGLSVKKDAALLDTLTYLTEFPTPILGRFDESYLSLPEEVLVTVMRHHQRYFSVVGEDGKLAPCFVAVMNTSGDPEGLVRSGNERVLRARFNDARFFWDVDQHKPLAARVEELANVTFQARLGSYLDKARRMEGILRELGGGEEAFRAALLAKCDLTTEMVKEFTELQGVVGGLYARAQGEPEEVAAAIYDQYRPESMEDAIPRSPAGRLVALADKLDTLRGCFSIGLIPTGSKDPFALRRAAQGVVRILVEGPVAAPFESLAAGNRELADFLLDRARYYFREIRGFRYDEVNAVLAAGAGDLVDALSRLEALRAVRPTENFEPLAASFKRIQNILRQAGAGGGGAVDPALLETGPETDLHAAFLELRGEVEARRGRRDYTAALDAIASLRPRVDLFFDKVLVNAPDGQVRANRLNLLGNLLTEFSSIAVFSEIVTS